MPSDLESYGFQKVRDTPTAVEWDHGDPYGLPGRLHGTVELRAHSRGGLDKGWEVDRVVRDDFGERSAQLIATAEDKDDAVETLSGWVRQAASSETGGFF